MASRRTADPKPGLVKLHGVEAFWLFVERTATRSSALEHCGAFCFQEAWRRGVGDIGDPRGWNQLSQSSALGLSSKPKVAGRLMPLPSKVIPMKTLARTCLALVLTCLTLSASAVTAEQGRTILDPWTGKWAGEFKVYGQDGQLLTTLKVEQHYRWDGDIQRAKFRETDAQGNVVTADARNYVDDQGELVCEVDKSTGESSKHRGNFADGYLFWHGKTPGRVETFRERVVVDEQGQRTYEINGFGVYGEGKQANYFLFAGRYRAVAEPEG